MEKVVRWSDFDDEDHSHLAEPRYAYVYEYCDEDILKPVTDRVTWHLLCAFDSVFQDLRYRHWEIDQEIHISFALHREEERGLNRVVVYADISGGKE